MTKNRKMNRWTQMVLAVVVMVAPSAQAESTFLGNNKRTGYVSASLPNELAIQWVVEQSQKPMHAWKEPYYMQQFIDFDYVDHSCIAYGKVYFGSSADGAVRAVSAETGELEWTFFCEAAVRFAPVAYQKKIYFCSDDGFLYCVDHVDGTLAWKKRCAPADTKCVGNDRLVSRWPMRSGVLIQNDKLYTAAGMWSRDGVFIYCMDPVTGKEIWRNDTSGFHFSAQPHGSGMNGVAPQGPLAISDDMLYVPTGRAAPAFYKADTGKFVSQENGLGYKTHYPGGSWVMQADDWLIFKRRQNHTESKVPETIRHAPSGYASGLIFYNKSSGKPEMAWTAKNMAVVNGNQMILAGAGPVIKVDFQQLQKEYLQYGDLKTGRTRKWDKNIRDSNFDDIREQTDKWAQEKPFKLPTPALMSPVPYQQWAFDAGKVYCLQMTDSQVLLGGEGKVTMLDLESGKELWKVKVEGTVRGLAIDADKVVASTTEGRIYCFSGTKTDTRIVSLPTSKPEISQANRSTAKELLGIGNARDGHALVIGAANPEVILAMIEESNLVVSCLTDKETHAAELRAMCSNAGYLGTRVNVYVGDMNRPPFMKYLFNSVFAGEPFGNAMKREPTALAAGGDSTVSRHAGPEASVFGSRKSAEAFYEILRPYDGRLVYVAKQRVDELSADFNKVVTANDTITKGDYGFTLTRGALVGAGTWVGPFADMGRTSNSGDGLVKPPLGILWWGGPGSRRIMSRHYISPVPLFAQGYLFVQGQDDIIGVDAYNGREMWNRDLKNIGRSLMPMRGGNIVSDESNVYCVSGLKCYALKHQTGETVGEFTFNPSEAELNAALELGPLQFKGKQLRPVWEYLGVIGDTLIGTLGVEDGVNKLSSGSASPYQSKTVFAFDKNTGETIWTFQTDRTVQPPAIVADSNRLYVLDRTPESVYLREKRRGDYKTSKNSLKAIDLSNGKLIYETNDLPLACKSLMLSDGVIVAVPNPTEVVIEEARQGLVTFDSETGNILWAQKNDIASESFFRRGQQGYHFINGDTLYTPRAFDLRTGKEKLLRVNPLSGAATECGMHGLNFCGGVATGKNIALYRSSSAGYTDLNSDSGNFWLPEIRTSCWVSMVPAGGVLLSQEGTASCTCSYSYKTSLALVPVERQEDWTIHLKAGVRAKFPKARKTNTPKVVAEEVNFLRINFGAPGDFYDKARQQHWLSYPKTRLKELGKFNVHNVGVTGGENATTYHFNADYHDVIGTDNDQLFLTGFEGNQDLSVSLNKAEYQVRLQFAEVKGANEGERVFNVLINGEPVLRKFDIVAKAGGQNKAYESESFIVDGPFTLSVRGKSDKEPLIAGIEITKRTSAN